MFRGLNAIAVDVKGRIALPARVRPLLEKHATGRLVVTIDTQDPCLLIYPYPTWEKVEEKLSGLSHFNPATRRIQRLLIGHATEVDMDRSGRILVPQPLREYAGLGSNVMLVGQCNKFELWGETQWQTSCERWVEAEKDKPEDDLPTELESLPL